MKKLLSIIAVLGLLSSCGGKEDLPSNGNNNEVAATAIALDNTEVTVERGGE